MKVRFNGIGEKIVTFKDGGATQGKVCKISANGQVDDCSAGDLFAGVALHIRDGYADVQTGGFVTLDYTGTTAPTLGWCAISADGSGGVKSDASGRKYLVAELDTTAKTLGVFLN